MKKFAAHYVFPISSPPIKNGIVKTDETGKITEVIDSGENFREEAGLEFHNGIICPDFIIPPSNIHTKAFINQYRFIPSKDYPATPRATLELLKTIQGKNKSLGLNDLLKVFTLDLAKFCHSEKDLGSIEPGKKPGLIVISGVDFKKMGLTANSFPKKLI